MLYHFNSALLHDAMAALLGGITTRIGNEIKWQDKIGMPVTINLIDADKELYTVSYYGDDGKIMGLVSMTGNKPNGNYIRYYSNGRIEEEGFFINGRRYGIFKQYYKDGTTACITTYRNNKLDGERCYYYDNGKIKSEVNYLDGTLHGWQIQYNKNGKVESENYFKKDKVCSKYTKLPKGYLEKKEKANMEFQKNDPRVSEIVRKTYPGYKGRKSVKVYARETKHISDYWDGGSRTYAAYFNLKTMTNISASDMGFERQAMANPFSLNIGEVKIIPETAVVEESIFCGKSIGLSISIHPDIYKEWEKNCK